MWARACGGAMGPGVWGRELEGWGRHVQRTLGAAMEAGGVRLSGQRRGLERGDQ